MSSSGDIFATAYRDEEFTSVLVSPLLLSFLSPFFFVFFLFGLLLFLCFSLVGFWVLFCVFVFVCSPRSLDDVFRALLVICSGHPGHLISLFIFGSSPVPHSSVPAAMGRDG